MNQTTNVGQLARGFLTALVSVGMLLGSFLLSEFDAANLPPIATQAAAREPTLAPFLPTLSPTPSPTSSPETSPLPSTPAASPTPRSPLMRPDCAKPPGWIVYTVQRGDTLTRLALRGGTTVLVLMQANCLRTSAIQAGQQIHLPPTFHASPTPRLYRCGPPLDWDKYKVRPGDTLYALSRRFGAGVDAMRRANCLDGYVIYAGQVLYVPPLSPTPTPQPTVTWTPSLTPSPPPTPTPTVTVSPALTITPTLTPTATSTSTPTPTVTATPTGTVTHTPSPTPTLTPTLAGTPTPLPSPSASPVSTELPTATSTPTPSVTPTSTERPTASPTPTPSPTVSP